MTFAGCRTICPRWSCFGGSEPAPGYDGQIAAPPTRRPQSLAYNASALRPKQSAPRSASVRGNPERRQERLDAQFDLVPDRSDGLDVAPCRIGEHPVLVALTGIERAGVPASHGDHDIDGANDFVGPRLWELCPDVDPDLVHGLDDGTVDLRGRLGAS